MLIKIYCGQLLYFNITVLIVFVVMELFICKDISYQENDHAYVSQM